MYQQSFKPILVICFPVLTQDQLRRVWRKVESVLLNKITAAGWEILALEGFDKMDVRAFGVPESEFESVEELKQLLKQQIENDK